VVESYLKVPSEVTANNRFSAKHTDDCRIYPRVSKFCDFYPAQVGGSKHARYLISQGEPQIAVRGFAIGHQTFGDNQIAIKAGIKKRLNSFNPLVQDNYDGNIGC
jgi:hypothetical protein